MRRFALNLIEVIILVSGKQVFHAGVYTLRRATVD